jgi:hypothetical protein
MAFASGICKCNLEVSSPGPIPLSSGIPRVPHIMSMFQPCLAFLSPQSQNLGTGRRVARENTHNPYKSDASGLECCILASYEFVSDFCCYSSHKSSSLRSRHLGEVALQPSVGGTFVVQLYTAAPTTSENEPVTIQKHLLWDRKAEGGFPGMLPLISPECHPCFL